MIKRSLPVVFGILIGAILSAIVAVNVIIFSGADEGYETTLPEVFDQNLLVGLVVVGLLVAGPIVGGVVAARIVRRRDG